MMHGKQNVKKMLEMFFFGSQTRVTPNKHVAHVVLYFKTAEGK
jgi:hypothetical protein